MRDTIRARRRDIYRGGAGRGHENVKGLLFVLLSYILDWVLLAAGAAIGYVLGELTPNKRPFSPADRSISFPHYGDGTVPGWLLVVCSAVVPIIIIAVVSLTWSYPTTGVGAGVSGSDTSKTKVWKMRAWELHAGWIGLALSLISSWIITNGLKNMFGKPRPDMLSRCQPDMANLEDYLVGFNGPSSRDRTGDLLVSAEICRNPDGGTLDDGFRAFPSGHASLSAAGLVYLSLFLLTKFAIITPFLVYTIPTTTAARPAQPPLPTTPTHTSSPSQFETSRTVFGHQQQQNADDHPAQPLYLLLLALVPFFAAIFIGSSRWFDFRHHGVDIIVGMLIGTYTAVFAFYYYHMPIARGMGRAWGPRRKGRAFWNRGETETGRVVDAVDVVNNNGIDGAGRGTGMSTGTGTGMGVGVPENINGRPERDGQVGKYARDISARGSGQLQGNATMRRLSSEDAVADHAV